MITQIELKNIKGQNQKVQLTCPVVVFSGENGAGKTAFIDAVQVALLGHHIKLGTRANALLQLCSAQDAHALVTINGSSSGFEVCDGKIEQIESKGVNPFLIDLSTFLGLPGKDRVAYLLSISELDKRKPVIDWPPWPALEKLVESVSFDGCASKWLNKLSEVMAATVREQNAIVKSASPQMLALRSEIGEPIEINEDALNEWVEDLSSVSSLIGAINGVSNARLQQALVKTQMDEIGSLESLKEAGVKLKSSLEKENGKLELLLQTQKSKEQYIASIKAKVAVCPTCKRGPINITPTDAESAEVALSAEMTKHESLLEVIAEVQNKRTALIKKIERNKADQETYKRLAAQTFVTELPGNDQRSLVTLTTRQESLKAAIDHGMALKAKKQMRDNAIARREKLSMESVAATNLSTHASTAGKLIKEASAELVEKSIGPLLARANKLMDGLFPKVDLVDGEFGIHQGRSFVSKTLSGAEQLCVFAALQVALCSDTTPGCRILMVDELSRLSPNRKIAFLRRMNELVKDGVIDQFLGCDVVQPGIAAGWLQSVAV
jgi:hypothetical protein